MVTAERLKPTLSGHSAMRDGTSGRSQTGGNLPFVAVSQNRRGAPLITRRVLRHGCTSLIIFDRRRKLRRGCLPEEEALERRAGRTPARGHSRRRCRGLLAAGGCG